MVMTTEKGTQTITKSRLILPRRDNRNESLDDSLVSLDSETDPRDPEWNPEDNDCNSEHESDSESPSDDTLIEKNEAHEKKYIVFESCLDRLFETCSACGLMKIKTHKKTIGTCVIYSAQCLKCGNSKTWTSQPMSGTMPYGNLILSAAIMFAGASAVKYLRVLDFACIQNVSISTYMNIQSAYLTPTIMDVWKQRQEVMLQEIREEDRSLKLAGDARCCTPGHTAKFGSYSMMDLHTGKIIDIKLVQVRSVPLI